jgi:predicted house-cleaning noncanonical NTP pyrophosphatase (MazG superfamily)
MKQIIYWQDLSEGTQEEIIEQLKEELRDEIEEAVENGVDKETAEIEVVDNYINTHNFANEFIL